jgi:hypothetical protein
MNVAMTSNVEFCRNLVDALQWGFPRNNEPAAGRVVNFRSKMKKLTCCILHVGLLRPNSRRTVLRWLLINGPPVAEVYFHPKQKIKTHFTLCPFHHYVHYVLITFFLWNQRPTNFWFTWTWPKNWSISLHFTCMVLLSTWSKIPVHVNLTCPHPGAEAQKYLLKRSIFLRIFIRGASSSIKASRPSCGTETHH